MVIEEQSDQTMEFVKYSVSKKKVMYLLEKLKSYSAVMHTFKKMEESIDDELNASVYPNTP
jgi:Mg2+ and Co2+ transporter CorA